MGVEGKVTTANKVTNLNGDRDCVRLNVSAYYRKLIRKKAGDGPLWHCVDSFQLWSIRGKGSLRSEKITLGCGKRNNQLQNRNIQRKILPE